MVVRIIFIVIVLIGIIIVIPLPEPICIACGKVGLNSLGVILVVLGAIGAWRTRGLADVGKTGPR
jgi:hypothetical protein